MNMEQHLREYIENNKKRIVAVQEEIDDCTLKGNFEHVATFKLLKTEITNINYRLEKIANGLPAFDTPINNTDYDKGMD